MIRKSFTVEFLIQRDMTQQHLKYMKHSAQEVTVIRKMAPINLILYYPQTKDGKDKLARRVSDIHAASVNQRLKALNCPTNQKLKLLDAVIATVKKRSREQA